jgi:hypothetical protein
VANGHERTDDVEEDRETDSNPRTKDWIVIDACRGPAEELLLASAHDVGLSAEAKMMMKIVDRKK